MTTDSSVTSRIPPTKPEIERSELWVTLIGAIGSALSAMVAKSGSASIWVSFATLVATAATYAIMRTPIAINPPGWKTPAFWGALATVAVSVTVAISEANIPGLPVGLTKIASIITAALTAAGYTAIRYSAKRNSIEPPAPPINKVA